MKITPTNLNINSNKEEDSSELVVLMQRIAPVGLFILALVMRIAYQFSLVMDNPIRADAGKYMALAYNLVTYHVYSFDLSNLPQPSNLITPGYPLFLALIFAICKSIDQTYVVAITIQAILGATCIVLTYFIGKALFSQRLALTAAFIAAVSPHLIVMTGYLLTETLFSFLLMTCLYLLTLGILKEKFYFYALSGIFLGMSALVRPAILLFPFCLFIIWITTRVEKKRYMHIAVLALSTFIVWLPWQTWSYHAPANNQSLARNVFVLGSYPDLIFKSEDLQGFPYKEDEEYDKMRESWPSAIKTIAQRWANEPEKYTYWYAIGKPLTLWQWSNRHAQGGEGPFIYPINSSIYGIAGLHSFSYSLLEYLHRATLTLALLSLVLLLFTWKKSWKNPVSLKEFASINIFSILFYTTAIHIVFAPLPRFSMPLYSILYLSATSAFFTILYKIGGRYRQKS